MNYLFWLTLVLLGVAVLLRSELFFYLLYVVVGLQVLARLWLRQTARALAWRRELPVAMFPGDEGRVTIALHNRGLLPIPWLSVRESTPPALQADPPYAVLALGAGEQRAISYAIRPARRGYYRVGPLTLRTGDALGLGERVLTEQTPAALTVYPRVLLLPELGLPAALPFGVLPATRSLFTDPARPIGVRPYLPGDSMRSIDWKTSARSGVLQVRRHQPAIALETMVALAFSRNEYATPYLYDALERAAVAAASIAVAVAAQDQPVGLCASGRDAASGGPAAPIAPGQGRAHTLALLGLLGRLEPQEQGDLPALLLRATATLGWGATVVVISGQHSLALLPVLLPLRRRGLCLALVLHDALPEDLALARRHGIAAYDLSRQGAPAPVLR